MENINKTLLEIIKSPVVTIEHINQCLGLIKEEQLSETNKNRIINTLAYKVYNQTHFMQTKDLMKYILSENFEKISNISFAGGNLSRIIAVSGMIDNKPKMKAQMPSDFELPKLGSYQSYMCSGLYYIESEDQPTDEEVERKTNKLAKTIEEILNKNDINISMYGKTALNGYLETESDNTSLYSASDIWEFCENQNAYIEIIIISENNKEPLILKLRKKEGKVTSSLEVFPTKNILSYDFKPIENKRLKVIKDEQDEMLNEVNQTDFNLNTAISAIMSFTIPPYIDSTDTYRKQVIVPLTEKYIDLTNLDYESAHSDICDLYDIVNNRSCVLMCCTEHQKLLPESSLIEKISTSIPRMSDYINANDNGVSLIKKRQIVNKN